MAEDSPYLTTPPRSPARAIDLDLVREVVAADVYARSRQLNGLDTRLAAGSLDHADGVQDAAFERGGTPEGLAGRWAERWEDTLQALDVEPDAMVHTSDAAHERVVKALFLKLFDQGDIEKAGEGYVLRASKRAKAIVGHLEDRRDFILPSPLHEAVLRQVVEEGIDDLTVSRQGSEWAILVPIGPELAIADWFEGLVAYLTGSGYLADPQLFERVWPPTVQILANEDLRVHAVAWPALLLATGLQLPEHLLVRGRVESDGPADAAELIARLGSDAVRYGLLRAGFLASDVELPLRKLVDLCNTELAGRLGRLIDDVVAAIEQRREGSVPRPGKLGDAEGALIEAASALFATTSRLVGEFEFRNAFDRVWGVVGEALDYAAGVGLASLQGRRLDTALYVLAETCRLVALSLRPFLPRAAWAIEARLGLDYEGKKLAELGQWGLTQPQARVQRGDPLIPRVTLPAT